MEKFFSPSYSVYIMRKEVLQKPDLLCKAFRERIYEYYINPARNVSAFAQGVLCSTLIDFLAKLIYPKKKVGDRIIRFLIQNMSFSEENAESFYYYVRNGLIHEGRVKCGCYLDNETKHTVQINEGVLKFNPEKILNEVEIWFEKYLIHVAKGREIYHLTRDYIDKNIIEEDLKSIGERDEGNNFPCKK